MADYKLKTHKGSVKRFKFTKNGKIKKISAFRRKNLRKKSTKNKRQLRVGNILDKTNFSSLKKLMPYA